MKRYTPFLAAAALLAACGESTPTTPVKPSTPEVAPARPLFDDIYNNLDATLEDLEASIDATVEVMNLQVGGPTGAATLFIQPRNGDGDTGCNLSAGEQLVVSVSSNNTSVATVSPSSVTFAGPGCGSTGALTITPGAQGTATITVTQVSNNSGGTFNLAPATFDVNVAPPAVVSATFVIGNTTQTYDGTSKTVTVTPTPSNATYTVTYAGTGSTTYGPSTTGPTDAGTYSVSVAAGAGFSGSASGTLTIDPKGITGSFTAANKVYDGTTSATITGRSLSGVVSPDDASLTGGTATFADKNVGTGKTVTGTGFTLSGADAGNYSLTSVATTTADITPRALNVTATGQNKVYDGTTAATVTLSTDKLGSDAVTASYTSASFADKNVGTGKTVSVSGISIAGADAGNYALQNTTASTTANITAKSITGSFTAANKYYDGTTSATITGRSLSGVISPDDVSLTGGTATFTDALVGNGKTVTGTGFTLTGADAGNYTLASSTLTTTANILAWLTSGFYQPVDMGTTANTVKAGSTVPLKFELFAGSVELTTLSSVLSVKSVQYTCSATAPEDAIEELSAAGSTLLRYDATAGQFIYNWKTPATPNTCHKVVMTAADGSTISALFKLK